MRKYLAVLGVMVLGVGGTAGVAQALVAGHVPVYIIPWVKSNIFVPTAESFTVISITRVGGTTDCQVSLDWRRGFDGALLTTQSRTLRGNTAANHYVGGTATFCSSDFLSPHLAQCHSFANIYRLDDMKVVVGSSTSCVGSLAVEARVIYAEPVSGVPLAVHPLRVLKPHTLGNKGD